MSDVPVRRATVTVQLPDGLHLRPLTQISQIAQTFDATTTLLKGDQKADAKRPLELMTLVAVCGEQLELESRGVDAEAAVDAIVELFESNFPEG